MARLYGPGPTPPPPLVATADLAGLSTSDVDGRPVGELYGALSEEKTGLIRYLDVSIRTDERHVLVPIGHARIDRSSVPPRVRLRAATQDDLLSIPPFYPDRTSLDLAFQNELMESHGRLFYGSRYYAHPAYDHAALDAGGAVIEGPDEVADDGLRPLSELGGFGLTRSAPDLLGWPLEDEDGERVGTIEDLIVEVAVKRERYLIVALDEPARRTVLPVGYVTVDRHGERARTPALSREDIRLLPAYEPPLTRAAENRIHAAIEGRLSGDRYFDRADFRTPATAP